MNLNEKSFKINRIRTDRGTEYFNKSLSKFLEDFGINHELSTARTPRQNGVAERINITLKEAAYSMLADSGISQCFRVESVNIACYTQNRSMINKNHGKNPYEIWNDKKSNVSYFKVFGGKCYVHNNGKNQLTTFDVKYDEGILLGYSVVSKAYRFFNKRTLEVEESIHSVFDESVLTD